MTKCAHGVYLPAWAVDGRNPYCSCCENFGKVPRERAVNLPGKSSTPLESGGCPECGSTVWLRVAENGSDANRECGECGRKYKRKLTVHEQFRRLFEAEEQKLERRQS